MIHILLLILKIIGIALLSVLGIALLIVLAVLFVPIRYSLAVKADDGTDGQAGIRVRACVSWFLHFLHMEAAYDGTFGVVIRLFGVPIKRIPAPEEHSNERKEKQKKKNRARKDASGQMRGAGGEENESGSLAETAGAAACAAADGAAAVSVNSANDGTDIPDGVGADEAGTDTSECGVGADEAGTDTLEYGVGADEAGTDTSGTGGNGDGGQAESDGVEPEYAENGKRSFLGKIARFFRKIAGFFGAVRTFFSKILYTIRNICGKIEHVKELIGYYLKVLRSEEGQRVFALVKRELGKLLWHIAPTKLTGSLIIGMDDPAATGQIIAVLSMFYPIYGNNVSITPDFDEKCIRGSLYLKGRIRIITLIRIAWRVYFNKDMKKFLHMLKREENEA